MTVGALLRVDGLSVEFRGRGRPTRAVNGVSYTLEPGRTLALVGESGSGKSVSALAVMGILRCPPAAITGGSISYHGMDLLGLPPRQRRKLCGEEIAMVFQDPLSSLNPAFTVGFQIGEMFRAHQGLSWAAAKRRAVELMERVRIPSAAARLNDYPHQFSGGMRQRIMIAMALALDPRILIADEPTTALDVTVQAQIMAMLGELGREGGMGLLLITHDLGVVAEVADEIAVMYAGRIVEMGPAAKVLDAPAHPYTRGLVRSVPSLERPQARLAGIEGSPPDLASIPPGCPFHPRCPEAIDVCSTTLPQLRVLEPERSAACHVAEKVLHA